MIVLAPRTRPLIAKARGGAGSTGEKGDPGSAGEGYATRSALATAGSTATALDDAYLTESGRTGKFVFSTANLSALVAADTAQGVYVAPASDPDGSSGAWVRQWDGVLIFDWFGAIPNVDSAPAKTANNAAWDAVKDFVAALGWGEFYNGAPKIFFPSESYYWDDTILVDTPLWLSGNNIGFPGAIATQFYFPQDTCGIKIDSPAIVEGFFLGTTSAAVTQDILNSGVRLRSRAIVRNVWVAGFPGCGILVNADALAGGEAAGNANGWQVRDCRIQTCLHSAMYIQGGDVNAGMAMNIDIAECGRFGIEELSFLGNMFIDVQVDKCGTWQNAVNSNKTAWVSDGTYRYTLKYGQEALATATPPTSGADNAVWKLEGIGGAAVNLPLYATFVAGGGVFQSGGSFYAAGSNQRSVFEGCYTEGNQPRPRILPPSFASGGFMGGFPGDGGYIYGTSHGLLSHSGFMSGVTNPADNVVMESGIGYGDLTTISHTKHDTYAPARWITSYGVNDGTYRPQDIWTHYNGAPAYLVTGPSTLEQYGTGVAKSHVFQPINFALGGYNDGSGRIIGMAAAAPTTGAHAQGEIVFNNAPTAGGMVGWVCTAAGTPGTWKTFGAITA
jgi:hypothetical protein